MSKLTLKYAKFNVMKSVLHNYKKIITVYKFVLVWARKCNSGSVNAK